jgi:NAD(P)-dependent dehydrogenase (short-subunit alcohol dehydrogenase family)
MAYHTGDINLSSCNPIHTNKVAQLTNSTKGISPADGPIAVTGASGYIGSWIVQDCVEQGYTVRTCVRDASNGYKVDHLLAMNDQGLRGKVELHEGDLFRPGSYDDAFKGCSAVIHTGAPIGYNHETPQEVYDGCFTEVEHVLASAIKGGALKRFVFTSSFAAVGHPRPDGYVYTEKDWCGDNVEAYNGRWTDEMIAKDKGIAYSMAKANTERMIYKRAEEAATVSSLPMNWQRARCCIRVMSASMGRMYGFHTTARPTGFQIHLDRTYSRTSSSCYQINRSCTLDGSL